jgi:hypothetical protein
MLATAERQATAETRGVVDTGDKFATAVVDTGGKFTICQRLVITGGKSPNHQYICHQHQHHQW